MTVENMNETLIKKLNECVTECHRNISACLEEEDVSMMARCIELNIDCSEICSVTAAFVARNSESTATILALCGEICKACGDECQKHDADHCQRCATICFECAQMCEEA